MKYINWSSETAKIKAFYKEGFYADYIDRQTAIKTANANKIAAIA
jgi:hypothetical protein